MGERRSRATLRALLEDGVPRRRVRSQSDEEELYGAPLGVELSTWLSVNTTHRLDAQSWGELRPMHFAETFGIARSDAAKKHLTRRPKLGWPVYFDAHFWNAFPIGASPGGDFWLARVQPTNTGASAAYRYEHETGELIFEAGSLVGLVERERREKRAPPTKAPKNVTLTRLDPIALSKRSYWLTTLLGGEEPDDLEREWKKNAPTFAVFESERTYLAEAPHLALYWLFAHALLRNEQAFREAYQATAGSKHAFVASARAFCKRLMNEEGKSSAGRFTPAWRAHIDETIARLRPVAILEPARRSALQSAAKAASHRLASAARDRDPRELIDAHPNDLDMQISALQALSKNGPPKLRKAVQFLSVAAKKGGSPGGSKWGKDWRQLFADPILRNLLLILFRRGQSTHWTEPLCGDWFAEPLAVIGGPEVTEALVTALVEPGYWYRRAKLARVLHESSDPRVGVFFEMLVRELPKLGDDATKTEITTLTQAAMARALKLGDGPALERLLTRCFPPERRSRLRDELAALSPGSDFDSIERVIGARR